MRFRLLFIIGLLAGYVLGARAGRERFEAIKDAASDAIDTPTVKNIVDAVTPDASTPDSTPGTGADVTMSSPAPSPAPTPAPSPAPKPAPPVSTDLPTLSTEEPLTTTVEDTLDPALVDALEDLAERDATEEDEARARRDDDD